MKYLSLDNPVKLNKKYILMGHIVLQAVGIGESGVLFKVLERQKVSAAGASIGSEFFTHNNDRDFWSSLKEYVEPPVKKKCFIILWFHPYGNLNPIRDQDVVSAQVYYGNGWIPVKGFEVEYNVPQSGD